MRFIYFSFGQNMRKIIMINEQELQDTIVEMYSIASFKCIFSQIS
jgi:hypothetical protein